MDTFAIDYHVLPVIDKERHHQKDGQWCWCLPDIEHIVHSDGSINYVARHTSWARRVSATKYRKNKS